MTHEKLKAAVAELVDALGDSRVEPYPLQRFAPGDPSRSSNHPNGGSS